MSYVVSYVPSQGVIGVDLSLKFCSLLYSLLFGPELQFKNILRLQKVHFHPDNLKRRTFTETALFPYPAVVRPALPPCSAEIHPALITAPLIHPSLFFLIYNACALILLWQTQLNYSSLLIKRAWYFKALGLLRGQIWSPSSLMENLASKAKEVKK